MSNMKKLKKYSWRPDIPDHRDRYFAMTRAQAKKLPATVSKIGSPNPVEDQGSLGSCTGNASTSALEIVLDTQVSLSRLMAYYNAREIDGTVNEDAGAYIRSAIKGLMKVGASSEDIWPYIITRFNKRPSSAAYRQAQDLIAILKNYNYMRVTTLDQVKQSLADRVPVVFGFAVPESFQSLSGSYTLKLPRPTEGFLGGHAVVAVGYNDRVKVPYIWVRNSWGDGWGLKGYFKMTQDWFTDNRRLVDDMWVIRKLKK